MTSPVFVSHRVVTALFSLLLVFSVPTTAQIELVKFDHPAKEEIYRDLIDELRCLVCANQSLSGSNASLAVDLRRKVRQMLDQDHSRQEIVDYMVERYGAYILYKPPLSSKTIVLWSAPVVILLLALWLALRSRRRQQQESPVSIDDADRQRVRELLSTSLSAGQSEEQPSCRHPQS